MLGFELLMRNQPKNDRVHFLWKSPKYSKLNLGPGLLQPGFCNKNRLCELQIRSKFNKSLPWEALWKCHTKESLTVAHKWVMAYKREPYYSAQMSNVIQRRNWNRGLGLWGQAFFNQNKLLELQIKSIAKLWQASWQILTFSALCGYFETGHQMGCFIRPNPIQTKPTDQVLSSKVSSHKENKLTRKLWAFWVVGLGFILEKQPKSDRVDFWVFEPKINPGPRAQLLEPNGTRRAGKASRWA